MTEDEEVREALMEAVLEHMPALQPPTLHAMSDDHLEDLADALESAFGEPPEPPPPPAPKPRPGLGDKVPVAAGPPMLMGERSRQKQLAQARKFGESIAIMRGGEERRKVVRFACRNADGLRAAGGGPEQFVKLFDRLTYEKPGTKARDLIGDLDDDPNVPAISNFAESRQHQEYQRSRVERFAEEFAADLKKGRASKETVLATFDDMLKRNPAATLEHLVGGSSTSI